MYTCHRASVLDLHNVIRVTGANVLGLHNVYVSQS